MSYIRDVQSFVDTIPYGDVTLVLKRIDRKTVQITSTAEETLKYENNEEAIEDLITLVRRLVDAGFTGRTRVELTLNEGQIKLLSVFDKKETKY